MSCDLSVTPVYRLDRPLPNPRMQPTDLAQAAKLRREAQSWMYATFTPGMWWKASTIREFVKHAGTYSIAQAHPPYHRAFYFALADMTVLVDDVRGVAMTLRDGRAIE